MLYIASLKFYTFFGLHSFGWIPAPGDRVNWLRAAAEARPQLPVEQPGLTRLPRLVSNPCRV